jgi:hypothetical protein
VAGNIELMGAIARAILNAISDENELVGVNWTEFTLIIGFDSDGDIDETYGYAYGPGGASSAFSVTPRLIRPEANAYRERLRLEGDKGMIKMLFQFNRDTRRVNADLEYENPKRWQVTPANIDRIVEELRPNLGTPQE